MAEPKIFLHVGLSKTATTSLQNHVFTALPGYQYLGKPWSGRYRDQSVRNALRYITYEDPVGYDVDFVKNKLERVIDIDGGSILISYEGLTYGRLRDPIYFNAVTIAKRLRDVFEGNTTVIFTIREQLSWLCSLHLDESSRNIFFDPGTTIGRWLAAEQMKQERGRRSALDMANFDDLIREYETIFGAHKIHVLVFEELVRNKDNFARRLCDALEFTDIDWMDCRLATMGYDKLRLSRRAYYFGLMNRLFVPEYFRGMYRALNPGLELFLQRGTPCNVTVPEVYRKILQDRYLAGNRRLSHLYGLDLGRYGYML